MIEKKALEIELEKLEKLQDITQPFMRLMMEYKCALEEIATKLRNLNQEFAQVYNRNPFETIKTRIKSPESILEKMQRREYEITLSNIETKLSDIAGVRVICSFQKDIYTLADLLLQQDDVVLVERKDYIEHPKPNGYRSLHLIVEVPIFLSSGKKMRKVEIQFRTIAMDFWASLDHKLRYKKDLPDAEQVAAELKDCAENICEIDLRMQSILEKIEDEGMCIGKMD